MRLRAYWLSFKLYARRVLRHWLWFFLFVGAAGVGLAQEYWPSLALPTWAWFSIAGGALVVAQFRAFHDMRVERDEALATQAGSGFPDVLFEPKPILVIQTQESKLAGPPHHETLLSVGMRATNREPKRSAILSFTAHVQTTKPAPTVRRLSRVSGESKDNLPDPWKLGPEDFGEGELLFTWGHEMDFLLGRGISEEDAIEQVCERLVLSVKDSLSQISVAIKLTDRWYTA